MQFSSELETLKRNIRFQCPKCHALGQFKVTGHDGFVYTHSPEYMVKCLSCGHIYDVKDLNTG